MKLQRSILFDYNCRNINFNIRIIHFQPVSAYYPVESNYVTVMLLFNDMRLIKILIYYELNKQIDEFTGSLV